MKLLSIILSLSLIGCTTAPPYTAREKQALTHAVIGQSLDTVTTDMVLSSGGREANTIWWNPDDAGGMLATKFAIMGAVYLVGQWKPEWRQMLWTVFAATGYGAATWNTYQMIDNGINPWRSQ